MDWDLKFAFGSIFSAFHIYIAFFFGYVYFAVLVWLYAPPNLNYKLHQVD